ncbi:hypothetical protein D3C78_1492840 [compost metagenome]
MAANHHRGRLGVGAGTTGKQVADRVNAQGHALFAAPMGEQFAAGLVFFAQGQTATAATGRRTDFSHGHQARPQAFAVAFQHRNHSSIR